MKEFFESLLFGIWQSDVDNYCREQNENLERLCKRNHIYVRKDFMGNYLYN